MVHTASEIMTKKAVTVRWLESIRTAYQMMCERKIRHLPVVDESGTLIGILSDRDLHRAMLPQTEIARAGSWDQKGEPEFDSESRVKDFMSWPVSTVSRNVSVQDVAAKMLKEKLSAVLVTDSDHGRFGIITTDDLLKLLLTLLESEPSGVKRPLDSLIHELAFI